MANKFNSVDWQIRFTKFLQWVFPLVIVLIDVKFAWNDFIGLIAWTFFICFFTSWMIHFAGFRTSFIFCILDFVLSTFAAMSFGVGLCVSLWELYSALKYESGMAYRAAVFGALCLITMMFNMYLLWLYLNELVVQAIVSSGYGLRRKVRRDERFCPATADFEDDFPSSF